LPHGFDHQAPFWCAYALHVLLFATVLGGALIHADRFRTPPALFLPILTAGFALPLLWPAIRPLPAWQHAFAGWQAGAVDGLVGIAAGVALAALGTGLSFLAGRGWPQFAPAWLLASLGVVLGWQGMLVAAPAVVLLYVAAAYALWVLGPLPTAAPPQPAETSAGDPPESDLASPLPAESDLSHEPNQPPA
jgi:hypothetical protein